MPVTPADNIDERLRHCSRLILERKWNDAERCVLDVVAEAPLLKDCYYMLGHLAIVRGKFELAADFMELLLLLEPNSKRALDGLIRAKLNSCDHDAADRAVVQMLQSNPDDATALYLRARVSHAMGRLDECRAAMARLRSLHSSISLQLLEHLRQLGIGD
ncbi:MAG: hypothetical protein AMXMBFR58_05290 [Phycisphaerae bacterium]